MKKLFLVLIFLPLISFAQDENSQNLLGNSICETQELICGGLSDSRCFGRPVDSICIINAQHGQTGFCRQVSDLEDANITCGCY